MIQEYVPGAQLLPEASVRAGTRTSLVRSAAATVAEPV